MHEQTGNTPTLLEAIASEIKKGEALGIGSPRASLESNFALRALVGEDNFYHGVPDTHFDLMNLSLRIIQEGTVQTPSLREVEQADAILILGEDLTATAPRLALALRQAVRRQPSDRKSASIHVPVCQDAATREAIQHTRAPLFRITPYATRHDDLTAPTLSRSDHRR